MRRNILKNLQKAVDIHESSCNNSHTGFDCSGDKMKESVSVATVMELKRGVVSISHIPIEEVQKNHFPIDGGYKAFRSKLKDSIKKVSDFALKSLEEISFDISAYREYVYCKAYILALAYGAGLSKCREVAENAVNEIDYSETLRNLIKIEQNMKSLEAALRKSYVSLHCNGFDVSDEVRFFYEKSMAEIYGKDLKHINSVVGKFKYFKDI